MISDRVYSPIIYHCSRFRGWTFRKIAPLWPLMKILTIIARVLLGLGFVVFGSNAFLHFIPMPPIPQTLAGDYTRVFLASGYVYVIGGLQVIGGLLLLIGRFVPLALTILGAILVNILIFHTLMAPEGFPPGLVFTALELFLVWRYREAFLPLLRP
jgi:putative oxidoreductase